MNTALGADEQQVAGSLNPEGAVVTHAPVSANYPDDPICGFMADGETVTADQSQLTCRDCIAALG